MKAFDETGLDESAPMSADKSADMSASGHSGLLAVFYRCVALLSAQVKLGIGDGRAVLRTARQLRRVFRAFISAQRVQTCLKRKGDLLASPQDCARLIESFGGERGLAQWEAADLRRKQVDKDGPPSFEAERKARPYRLHKPADFRPFRLPPLSRKSGPRFRPACAQASPIHNFSQQTQTHLWKIPTIIVTPKELRRGARGAKSLSDAQDTRRFQPPQNRRQRRRPHSSQTPKPAARQTGPPKARA